MNYENNVQLIPLYFHEMWLRLIANWRNNPDVKRNLRSAFDTNYDGQKDFAQKTRNSTDQYFYIVKKEKRDPSGGSPYKSDEYHLLLGYCGLDKLHFANRTAEISLLIAPRFFRKGYGTKAVKTLLNKSFNEFNLNLIYAETYFNKEFWNKAGFKDEAVLQSRKYFDGKYHSSYMMSVSRKDYFNGGRK